ncbi:hypothetical protein [Rhodococcus opacus]
MLIVVNVPHADGSASLLLGGVFAGVEQFFGDAVAAFDLPVIFRCARPDSVVPRFPRAARLGTVDQIWTDRFPKSFRPCDADMCPPNRLVNHTKEIMTAAVPRSSRAARRVCTSADSNERTQRHGSRLPAVSITLGALSIASFWVIGLGFILGAAAIVCGAIATSRSAVADDEAASLRALLGVLAGVAGITVSAIALFPMPAQL